MKESQLDNKTAIATNDYVRMVDENGNSVKIKKDSFMAAIRDAFPSIISDGETGGGSVLSIINGALKTRTDANLASVLGVIRGAITTDDDYSLGGIQYGYGLLIITNITDGSTSTYNVNAFNVERISNTDCGATVTKSGEYTLIIKRLSGKSTGYVFVSMR